MRWSTLEREFFGYSKGLQKLEPWVKGFMVTLWTDHLNTTYIQALSGSRRINKKITGWALEVVDILRVRVWRKGVTNVLADVPSRWSAHVGKVTELVRNLPRPPVKFYDIVKKIFHAPDEYAAR